MRISQNLSIKLLFFYLIAGTVVELQSVLQSPAAATPNPRGAQVPRAAAEAVREHQARPDGWRALRAESVQPAAAEREAEAELEHHQQEEAGTVVFVEEVGHTCLAAQYKNNSSSTIFLQDNIEAEADIATEADIEAEAEAPAAPAADSAGERAEPVWRRGAELLLVRQSARPDQEVRQVRPEGPDADAGVRHQRGLPLLQVEEERRGCR